MQAFEILKQDAGDGNPCLASSLWGIHHACEADEQEPVDLAALREAMVWQPCGIRGALTSLRRKKSAIDRDMNGKGKIIYRARAG